MTGPQPSQVPDTIGDAQMDALRVRAAKANPDWVSDDAIRVRKAQAGQLAKADQS